MFNIKSCRKNAVFFTVIVCAMEKKKGLLPGIDYTQIILLL